MSLPLRVVPVPGYGAEDVLVGADGKVWTGTVDGAVHVHDPVADTVRTVAATGGRPLGLEWLPDGRLLICDAHRGLLALDLDSSVVETLASEDDGVPFLLTNNAAVQADGTIWFSDSSQVWGVEDWKNDLIEHTSTGRLLRRTTDGAVEPVLDGLAFANGVALTSAEDAVLVAETGTCRIRRLSLTGGRPGPATTW
ncbi:MAG: SMP-30/gluconolactonase/LRE family protein, partial [Dermatophilaceae bacterium]